MKPKRKDDALRKAPEGRRPAAPREKTKERKNVVPSRPRVSLVRTGVKQMPQENEEVVFPA
jgi:hypothetical protein